MNLLVWLGLLILAVLAFERFLLRGRRIKEYPVTADINALQRFTRAGEEGPEHRQVIKTVRELTLRIAVDQRQGNHKAARDTFDSISQGHEYKSEFFPTDAGGVPAEWVIAPGADSNRRVLYIHGGGFVVGSPKSHRTITSKFSEVTGCAVLAIDYRLMPEHLHRDCVDD